MLVLREMSCGASFYNIVNSDVKNIVISLRYVPVEKLARDGCSANGTRRRLIYPGTNRLNYIQSHTSVDSSPDASVDSEVVTLPENIHIGKTNFSQPFQLIH